MAAAGGGAYAAFERASRERVTATDNANREMVLFYAGPGPRHGAPRSRTAASLDALAVALEANGKAEARAVMSRVLAVGVRDPEIHPHAGQTMGLKPQ